MSDHPPLPIRPTAHERDGRTELSVPAEMARVAHELQATGYPEADISRALVADELTIELLLPRLEGPR
ncbi:hypothetical protein ACFPK5_00390 [Streptomyces beijiangensis]|uniref:hypothetical protein n=1 Tax=Streptomyces beijiangensis TaxID=163361 RepID=UPI0031D3CDA0